MDILSMRRWIRQIPSFDFPLCAAMTKRDNRANETKMIVTPLEIAMSLPAGLHVLT